MREYIAKDVVLSEINDNAPFTGTDREEYILASVIEIVRNTPATDVELVRHGEWRGNKCSICGAQTATDAAFDYLDESDQKYCYACGAKMDGGSEDD